MTERGSKDRKFYEIDPSDTPGESAVSAESRKEELTEYIHDHIIGRSQTFLSPFGRKKVLYCDHTASGQSLSFIEDFISQEVLPLYGNTHTTTSVTSLQTTLFRHEARDIVRNSCNAGELDAVIFTGSGTTGAVHKLIKSLKLDSPTVFVGPNEHHSNLLPWREIGASVVNIRAKQHGQADLTHLESELKTHRAIGDVLVGCFTAASNVTGVLEDDLAVTSLLHKYGALSFWDYATAAPYVNIDVNPKVASDPSGLCYKDAVYFSVHKFLGGVQTPGVLIAKKSLFQNSVPEGAGGGAVFYVTDTDHRFLQEPEMREEGGTPAIVESVRAGLVFKLKQSVGAEFIMQREEKLRQRFIKRFENNPNLLILGSRSGPQLAVFSFLVRHPATGLYLHHNYVTALLNDLFGLQTRGGCACAGPLMQSLLGLSREQVRSYEAVLVEDSRLDRIGLRRQGEHSQWEVVRPGATRLNLPWVSTEEELDLILSALEQVVEQGWKLLPQYRFNNETGEWRHRTNSVFRDRRWLGHVSFSSGQLSFTSSPLSQVGQPESSARDCLAAAREVLSQADKVAARETVPDQTVAFPEEVSRLRWFLTPYEAKCCLTGESLPAVTVPFSPPVSPSQGEAVQPCPGSLSGRHHLSPSTTATLQSAGSNTAWTPNISNLTRGISLVGRQSIRRLEPSSLARTSSVTVNGCTTVPVNGDQTKDPAESGITINGYKSVISVTAVAADEKSELNFEEEEEETDCDKKTDLINDVMENMRSQLTIKVPEDETADCQSGLCVIPGGVRPDPVPAVAEPSTAKWRTPSKEVFKPFLEAVAEFSMVKDGDRLLVCLSGGKDSLSLLHCVKQYQYYAASRGINFTFGAVTVDPMSSAYDPRPLIPYLEQLGVEYLYEQQDIMGQALEANASSICAFCSRMKRGRIYSAARKNNYNVLALGQHLDDLTESFFMSIFHNGRLRSMKASYTNAEGDLRIIRPLVYAREKQLRKFAEGNKLPIIAENCPACFEAPKERARIKQLLAQQELLYPRLYWNLKTALYPVIRIDKTGLESVVFGKNVDDDELQI